MYLLPMSLSVATEVRVQVWHRTCVSVKIHKIHSHTMERCVHTSTKEANRGMEPAVWVLKLTEKSSRKRTLPQNLQSEHKAKHEREIIS